MLLIYLRAIKYIAVQNAINFVRDPKTNKGTIYQNLIDFTPLFISCTSLNRSLRQYGSTCSPRILLFLFRGQEVPCCALWYRFIKYTPFISRTLSRTTRDIVQQLFAIERLTNKFIDGQFHQGRAKEGAKGAQAPVAGIKGGAINLSNKISRRVSNSCYVLDAVFFSHSPGFHRYIRITARGNATSPTQIPSITVWLRQSLMSRPLFFFTSIRNSFVKKIKSTQR